MKTWHQHARSVEKQHLKTPFHIFTDQLAGLVSSVFQLNAIRKSDEIQ